MGRRADRNRPSLGVRSEWNTEFRRSRQKNLFALLDIIRSSRLEEAGVRHCGIIAVGELEDLPHSVTSLADALGEPRSSTSRRLRTLADNGLVRLEARGSKKLAFLTDAGWAQLERWWKVLDGPIDYLVATETAHHSAKR